MEQAPVQIGQFILGKNLGIGAFGKVRGEHSNMHDEWNEKKIACPSGVRRTLNSGTVNGRLKSPWRHDDRHHSVLLSPSFASGWKGSSLETDDHLKRRDTRPWWCRHGSPRLEVYFFTLVLVWFLDPFDDWCLTFISHYVFSCFLRVVDYVLFLLSLHLSWLSCYVTICFDTYHHLSSIIIIL